MADRRPTHQRTAGRHTSGPPADTSADRRPTHQRTAGRHIRWPSVTEERPSWGGVFSAADAGRMQMLTGSLAREWS